MYFEQATIRTSSETYINIRKDLKKILIQMGATKIQMKNSYFYFSGFCTLNSRILYFSCTDTREGNQRILFRYAKSYQDYKGEKNHLITFDEEKIKNLITRLK